MRRQIAGVFHFVKIQACRREFRNGITGSRADFNIKDLRAEHAGSLEDIFLDLTGT